MDGLVNPMRALVIGCGSIGRRHIRNLAGMGVRDIRVVSRRPGCLRPLGGLPARVTVIGSAAGVAADFAMICNETDRPFRRADPFLKRGMPVFIEKPVSHSLKEARRLLPWARRGKIFIAYNFRFLGAIRHIKGLLDRRVLGTVYSARFEVGQYLPDWRPGRDWKRTYSADPKRGGGVALDLSHEIDYMRYLFGDPVRHATMRSRAGGLESKVESLFEGLYQYADGFTCSVHMDYLQRIPRRTIRIVGTKAVLECDLIGKRMEILSPGRRRVLTDKRFFDLDKTYRDELAHFIRCVAGRERPLIGVPDGIRALELSGRA